MEGSEGRRKAPGAAILVTGAAGFLGRALVEEFVTAGEPVVALVRTPGQAARVERPGVRVEVVDVTDASGVARAAAGCWAAVHLASAQNRDEVDDVYRERVRVNGLRSVLRAATSDARLRRVVVGSGYWVYPSTPGALDESTAVRPAGESFVNFRTEELATSPEVPATCSISVVRPAMVYGDGAWLRGMVEALLDGSYSVVERGENLWSFVGVTDTAAAFRRVVHEGAPGAVYNVADGTPVSWNEFASLVAATLGVPAPPSIGRSEAVSLYGEVVTEHLLANRAVDPKRLQDLGWRPRYSSVRDGVPPTVRGMRQGGG